MSKKICVFFADGFEEIEGLTVVDLLRRAELEVTTISITEKKTIRGAHGIEVMADCLFEEMNFERIDMLVLPGGMPGTIHLSEHAALQELLKQYHQRQQYIAAICAAPGVLGELGFLQGRKATCYPGMEGKLCGAEVVTAPVAVDGHIITSRGMGTAIDFSLALIKVLLGTEMEEKIRTSIVYQA